MMNTLVFLQRFLVCVLISTHRTSLFDFEMDDFDVSLEHNHVLERFATSTAFVWSFAHVIN